MTVATLVIESGADGFIFENVTSILHKRNQGIVDKLVGRLREAGYLTTTVRGNAAEYGVAQARHRVFILGNRHFQPIAPKPSHNADSTELRLPKAVTAGEALDGLAGSEFHEPEEIVSGKWAEHLRDIPPGWNYKWRTAWAGHPDPVFEADTRFWNFLLKLAPDKPSWTITASPGPWIGPFHWDSRRLRTVEMAALQGFPREYLFTGKRREIVRQIGNAIPPPLATAMVKEVLHHHS
jgi:DNA (cytosine-5)-methyltransferase 1